MVCHCCLHCIIEEGSHKLVGLENCSQRVTCNKETKSTTPSASPIKSPDWQAYKYTAVSSPPYLLMVCFKNALHVGIR